MPEHTYTCIKCLEPVVYKIALKRGCEPIHTSCRKQLENARSWERRKAKRDKSPEWRPNNPGEGVNWSAGSGAKPIKRVDDLAVLYLQVTDANGRMVPHSAAEWLELAAELVRLRAFTLAEFCTRKGSAA